MLSATRQYQAADNMTDRMAALCHHEIETSIAQCAPAGAGGIGSVRSAFGESAILVEEGPGKVLAKHAAQGGASFEHGVWIDVATNLAGDVRLARKGQRERDESRFKPAIVECP